MLEPYNYTFITVKDSGYYTFLTKSNIEYRVAFYADYTLEQCVEKGVKLGNVFQISVYKVIPGVAPLDGSIAETIKSIIAAFFENEEDALIYICDDSDSKGFQRFNAFERWYNSSSMTGYVTKLNNVIEFNEDDESEMTTIHTSLMFHNNNTNIDNIRIAYDNLENVINGDKPDAE